MERLPLYNSLATAILHLNEIEHKLRAAKLRLQILSSADEELAVTAIDGHLSTIAATRQAYTECFNGDVDEFYARFTSVEHDHMDWKTWLAIREMNQTVAEIFGEGEEAFSTSTAASNAHDTESRARQLQESLRQEAADAHRHFPDDTSVFDDDDGDRYVFPPSRFSTDLGPPPAGSGMLSGLSDSGTAFNVVFTIDGVQAPQPFTRLYYLSNIVFCENLGWVELRCFVCDGNHTTNGLFRGVTGVKKHLADVHGMHGMTLEHVATSCLHKSLSKHEVEILVELGYLALQAMEKVPAQVEMEEDQKFWTYETQKANVVKGIECVVQDENGAYYELACPVCNGNAPTKGKKQYLKGVIGFADHVRLVHPSAAFPGLQELFEGCKVRPLTVLEVQAMQEDQLSAPKIKKCHSKA